MTLEELGEKLSGLDEIRRHAERELSALHDYQERVKQLEEDRDALLEAMAETVPEGLAGLTGGAQQGLPDAQIGGDTHTRGLLSDRCPEGAFAEWHGCDSGCTGERLSGDPLQAQEDELRHPLKNSPKKIL